MRKFVISVLAMALVLTCFSVVTFAAPTTNIYMGDGSGNITATSDKVTIDVFVDPSSNADMASCIGSEGFGSTWGLDSVSINLGFTNATGVAVGSPLSGLVDTSGDAAISFMNSGAFYTYSSEAFKIATITVNRADEAATSVVKLTNPVFTVGNQAVVDLTCQETLTITWPSSKPVVSDKAMSYDKDTFDKYTDVPCFNGSAKITGTYTGVKLGFDLYNGETFNKTVEPVSIVAGKTMTVIEDGTIKFKVAVIGVPAGTDVQIKNIVVNAE